jgi:hypothetical protein
MPAALSVRGAVTFGAPNGGFSGVKSDIYDE